MRVFSGIQPTGMPHLGNYFGAFKQWIKLQNESHECFFSIVNQHAITLPQQRDQLMKRTIEMGAALFSVGLDPQKSVIFIQSDIPEHSQLLWILNCLAPIGQIERMIQFKEKSEKNPETVNVGLFSYPILQAADILLYKTNIVPVGIDQAQHLELSRILAKKFNNQYKEMFPEPKTLHTKTIKILGLDGRMKMSKSYDNYIGLFEDKDTIWKKLAPAVTDTARITRNDPGNPDICNLYSLHTLFSTDEDLIWAAEGCRNAQIGCMDCKKKLLENIENLIAPMRERYQDWMNKTDEVREILHEGGKKARQEAQKNLAEIYDLVGFRY